LPPPCFCSRALQARSSVYLTFTVQCKKRTILLKPDILVSSRLPPPCFCSRALQARSSV
jgi:hypothetical protein